MVWKKKINYVYIQNKFEQKIFRATINNDTISHLIAIKLRARILIPQINKNKQKKNENQL